MMEGDDWDAGVPPNTLRHPQHHDHDSDDGSTDSQRQLRHRWSYDEADASKKASSFGHVTSASRRPAAVVRASSGGGTHLETSLSDIGFHPGQQTRQRSPIPCPTQRKSGNAMNKSNGTANSRRPNIAAKHAVTHKKGRAFRRRFANIVRLFVVIGVFVYLILMVLLLSKPDVTVPFDPIHPGFSNFNKVHSFFTRETADKHKVDDRRTAEAQAVNRATKRRKQTRPPPLGDREIVGSTIRYEIILMGDERRGGSTLNVEYPQTAESPPATLEDLCGDHAKKSAREHPNSFLASEVLNSRARVMITGVLNPLGFRLALALKERCGVQVLAGIDPMFPNTAWNRLELLERMKTLATNIPKMIQPIVLPTMGLNPRTKKRGSAFFLPSTEEVNLLKLLNFHPTHIVHLASYTSEEYRDGTAAKEGRINSNSPYVVNDEFPPLYPLRSSMASMEHVLASVASEDNVRARPHLTYASSMGVIDESRQEHDELYSRVKLVDELLADTYHSLKGVAAVGLRLPSSVYGPGGRPGAPEYELAEAAVRGWNNSTSSDYLIESAGLANVANQNRDFVYADDVVEAIIAAMQYRPEGSSPKLFNVGSGSVASLGVAAELLDSFKPAQVSKVESAQNNQITRSTTLFQNTREYLQWSPSTVLRDGMMKLLAWHLDTDSPFGSPPALSDGQNADKQSARETGDALVERNGAETCSADDVVCNLGTLVLPCAAECSSRSKCPPSVFDPIVDLTREVTEGCDIILYTQSLGYDVHDLPLESQYMEDGDRIVCNFAFVPRESKLVQTVTQKVPNSQLEQFGIQVEEDREDWEERRVNGLNGRLLYKGWILLWLDDAIKELSDADHYLLRMVPGKFFAPCVKHAMFVAENFPVTPNVQDILFLVDETRRSPLKQRSVYRNEEDGKKHKYVLEEEPARHAVLLTSPLKRMMASNHRVEDSKKMNVLQATKYMTFEIGGDPMGHEPSRVRKQREFYERSQGFVNRMDMKSPLEPLYKFEMSHWIRSRWIIHNLKVEEGRQFRCQWYREHVRWGSDLDQLSFAYVLNKRIMERRITKQGPDDHRYEDHPELKELTDIHEWHALLGEDERREQGAVADKSPTDGEKDASATWYVRIMSEKFMLLARKQWATRHRRKHKHG